jgi:hypothetical protein
VKALGSTTTCTVPTYGLAGQGKERKICIERTIMIWTPARAHTEPLLLGRFSWLARKKKVTEYCYWWYKKVHFPRAKRGASSSRLPICTLSKHLEPSSLLFHSAQSKPTNTTPIAHPLAKVEIRNVGCLEKQRRKQSQRKRRGGNFWATFQWWSKVFARALVSVDGQGTHSSFRALSLKWRLPM